LTQPGVPAVQLPPGLTVALELPLPEPDEPDVVLVELPVVAVEPDRPLVDPELELEVAGVVTTTRTRLPSEMAWPISTPTPTARSRAATPARSVALDHDPPRRAGLAPPGAGAGAGGWIVNRGLPRRVPHTTQYRWSGASAAPHSAQRSVATLPPISDTVVPDPPAGASVPVCSDESSALEVVAVITPTRLHSAGFRL